MSFFGKLRSNQNNGAQPASSSTKKAPTSTPLSPLEELIGDLGPVRNDGSDKYFGFHNPNTLCYVNSITQCLYYLEPFREKVLNYPSWLPRPETLTPNPSTLAVDTIGNKPVENGTAVSPRLKPQNEALSPSSPGRPAPSLAGPVNNAPKAEENKESFDYKKKQALATGPVVQISEAFSKSYGMEESLFTGLKDVFETLARQSSRTGVINPTKFVNQVHNTIRAFHSPVHQDAHEFLILMREEIVNLVEKFSKDAAGLRERGNAQPDHTTLLTEESGKAKDTTESKVIAKPAVSWFEELFGGVSTNEIKCLTCETVSQTDETFLDLSLDLEDNTSLSACLRRFSAEEMLRGGDKFRCDKCGDLQEAEKRMRIKKLPNMLAIHLKRFSQDMEGRISKVFHRVVYPFTMRLMNTTDECEDPDRLYELFAVVVHVGSTPVHGHYVSIINTKEKGWLLFDDELVLPVDKTYVRNFFGDVRNPATAYMLFYRQVDESIIERGQDIEEPPSDPLVQSAGEAVTTGTVDLNHNSGVGAAHPLRKEAEMSALSHTSSLPVVDGGYSSNDGHLMAPSPQVHPFSDTEAELAPDELPLPTYDVAHNGTSQPRHSYEDAAPPKDKPPAAGKNNAGLGRFRPGNMSLRHKPKFWGSREKQENLNYTITPDEPSDVVDPLLEEPRKPTNELHSSKSQKPKSSRFSLSRKRSTLAG